MWALRKASKIKGASEASKVKLANRRSEREDRRVFGPPAKFPFFDNLGKLVKMDRRTMPDRRIANIQVKEDYLAFDSKRFKKK
jgi:hypothetical protein